LPETRNLPSLTTAYGQATVTVRNVVLVRDEETGRFRHPDPEVGAGYMDALYHTPGVVAKRRGLLRPKPVCRQCATGLTGDGIVTVTAIVEYPVRNFGPNTIEVTAPGFRCPTCATGSLRTDRAADFEIAEAVRLLFEQHSFRD